MIKDLDQLISIISKLPSLGQRSAKKIVLHLIENRSSVMSNLIDKMSSVHKNIKKCQICNNLSLENNCEICLDSARSPDLLCIVENIADLWSIEKSGFYRGYYHILGGTLSAINGQGPESLNIDSLKKRFSTNNEIKEVIVATNPTMEGQTTAYYIVDIVKKYKVKVSKLANGMPIGGEIDYLDDSTLSVAFARRSEFE
jgi:recombination protein RecR